MAFLPDFEFLVTVPMKLPNVEVELSITAHHYGWSEFRLCREGGVGKDRQGVTQECFNNDVLRFDVADARNRYSGETMKPGQTPWSEYTPTDPSDLMAQAPLPPAPSKIFARFCGGLKPETSICQGFGGLKPDTCIFCEVFLGSEAGNSNFTKFC